MDYISTRGEARPSRFDEILLAGLAPDGGLFAPAHWPTPTLDPLSRSYAELAAAVIAPYAAPWLLREEIEAAAREAYAGFDHPDVAPLVQLGDEDWLLELFHGPTLAFKDIAMLLMARFFDRALAEAGRRATILGATSGDTGGAAVEAFRGSKRADLVILHPAGRVSDVQRLMMTTAAEPNIHNIAVEGTFDDCQRIVKALLSDVRLRAEYGLSAVNSINWARLAIQSVYYFSALAALGQQGIARASFSVPTGNFGDAFSGYAALRMGAAIDTICIAVNQNDIVHRAIGRGRYRPEAVAPSTSPSMDIQIASNFERVLFETLGRDPARVRTLMASLDEREEYEVPADALASIRERFASASVSEAENRATIANCWKQSGILIDPHTAVGIAATRKARAERRLEGPVVTLATAHSAKFPDAVEAASGRRPELPARYDGLFARKEFVIDAPASVDAVRNILVSRAKRT